MGRILRLCWFFWGGLTVFALGGTLLLSMSMKTVVRPLALTPGASIEISLFRPIPAPIAAVLWFDENRLNRPELGIIRIIHKKIFEIKSIKNHKTINDYEFKIENVGGAVKLKITDINNGDNYIYIASPAPCFFSNTARCLVPYTDKPEIYVKGLVPARGITKLNILVVEVGNSLLEERVKFGIQGVINGIYTSSGAGYINVFRLWPLYFCILIFLFIILCMLSIKFNKT